MSMDESYQLILKNAFTQVQHFQDKLFEGLELSDFSKPVKIPVFEPVNAYNKSSLPITFQNFCSKSVSICRPANPMRHAAHCVLTDNSVRIVYARHLNHCWARFMVAKELAHSFFYHDHPKSGEFMTGSSDELVQLIKELNSNMALKDGNPDTWVDWTASIIAVELLVPSRWMPKVREIYAALKNSSDIEDGTECLEVAQYFLVPERILELRLIEGFTLDDYYSAFQEQQFVASPA